MAGGGFDDLIQHLLTNIALSGDQGATTSDFKNLVHSFYDEQFDQSDQISNFVFHAKPTVDGRLLEKIWLWIRSHDDIWVGKDRQGNALTLAQIDALQGQSQPDTVAGAEKPENDATVPIDSAMEDPDGTEPSMPELRIYTSQDRIWQAAAGHSVDFGRVPRMEFEALCAIARAGPKGILQPDVVKVTGQDKRSLPKRTDLLHERGYITKRVVYVAHMKTSHCLHHRYVGEQQKTRDDADDTTSTSYGAIFTGKQLDLDHFLAFLLRTITVGDAIPIKDFYNKVGTDLTQWQKRSIWRCFERLDIVGVTQRCRLRFNDPNDTTRAHNVPCLRLLKTPNQEDRRKFHLIPTAERKAFRERLSVMDNDRREEQQREREALKLRRQAREARKKAKQEAAEAAKLAARNAVERDRSHVDPSLDSLTYESKEVIEVEDDDEPEFEEPEDEEEALLRGLSDADIDDEDDDDDKIEEKVRLRPSWDPDALHTDFLHKEISRAGADGFNAHQLKENSFGSFMVRPLDNILGRMTDDWRLAQPQHIRHLALVRDTAENTRISQYCYRTHDIYQAAVRNERAEWISVLPTGKKPKGTPQVHIDGWGFPTILKSDLVHPGGTASYGEAVGKINYKVSKPDDPIDILADGTFVLQEVGKGNGKARMDTQMMGRRAGTKRQASIDLSDEADEATPRTVKKPKSAAARSVPANSTIDIQQLGSAEPETVDELSAETPQHVDRDMNPPPVPARPAFTTPKSARVRLKQHTVKRGRPRKTDAELKRPRAKPKNANLAPSTDLMVQTGGAANGEMAASDALAIVATPSQLKPADVRVGLQSSEVQEGLSGRMSGTGIKSRVIVLKITSFKNLELTQKMSKDVGVSAGQNSTMDDSEMLPDGVLLPEHQALPQSTPKARASAVDTSPTKPLTSPQTIQPITPQSQLDSAPTTQTLSTLTPQYTLAGESSPVSTSNQVGSHELAGITDSPLRTSGRPRVETHKSVESKVQRRTRQPKKHTDAVKPSSERELGSEHASQLETAAEVKLSTNADSAIQVEPISEDTPVRQFEPVSQVDLTAFSDTVAQTEPVSRPDLESPSTSLLSYKTPSTELAKQKLGSNKRPNPITPAVRRIVKRGRRRLDEPEALVLAFSSPAIQRYLDRLRPGRLRRRMSNDWREDDMMKLDSDGGVQQYGHNKDEGIEALKGIEAFIDEATDPASPVTDKLNTASTKQGQTENLSSISAFDEERTTAVAQPPAREAQPADVVHKSSSPNISRTPSRNQVAVTPLATASPEVDMHEPSEESLSQSLQDQAIPQPAEPAPPVEEYTLRHRVTGGVTNQNRWRRQKRGIGLAEGSMKTKRLKLIVEIVRLAGGAFGGDSEIVRPFQNLSTVQGITSKLADRDTIIRTMRSAVQAGMVKRIRWSFWDKNGVEQVRHLLLLPEVEKTSECVNVMMRNIEEAWPQLYMPLFLLGERARGRIDVPQRKQVSRTAIVVDAASLDDDAVWVREHRKRLAEIALKEQQYREEQQRKKDLAYEKRKNQLQVHRTADGKRVWRSIRTTGEKRDRQRDLLAANTVAKPMSSQAQDLVRRVLNQTLRPKGAKRTDSEAFEEDPYLTEHGGESLFQSFLDMEAQTGRWHADRPGTHGYAYTSVFRGVKRRKRRHAPTIFATDISSSDADVEMASDSDGLVDTPRPPKKALNKALRESEKANMTLTYGAGAAARPTSWRWKEPRDASYYDENWDNEDGLTLLAPEQVFLSQVGVFSTESTRAFKASEELWQSQPIQPRFDNKTSFDIRTGYGYMELSDKTSKETHDQPVPVYVDREGRKRIAITKRPDAHPDLQNGPIEHDFDYPMQLPYEGGNFLNFGIDHVHYNTIDIMDHYTPGEHFSIVGTERQGPRRPGLPHVLGTLQNVAPRRGTHWLQDSPYVGFPTNTPASVIDPIPARLQTWGTPMPPEPSEITKLTRNVSTLPVLGPGHHLSGHGAYRLYGRGPTTWDLTQGPPEWHPNGASAYTAPPPPAWDQPYQPDQRTPQDPSVPMLQAQDQGGMMLPESTKSVFGSFGMLLPLSRTSKAQKAQVAKAPTPVKAPAPKPATKPAPKSAPAPVIKTPKTRATKAQKAAVTAKWHASRTKGEIDGDPDFNISSQSARRLFYSCIVVRTITGGEDQTIDWDVVGTLCKPYGVFVQAEFDKRFTMMLRYHPKTLYRAETTFQTLFLNAYDSNEWPNLDLEAIDDEHWRMLVDWAEDQLLITGSDQDLPDSRKIFDANFTISSIPRTNAHHPDYMFKDATTFQHRTEVVHALDFVSYLDEPEQKDTQRDKQILHAKTWARASIATPNEVFNMSKSFRTLNQLDNKVLGDAMQELNDAKILAHSNKGRSDNSSMERSYHLGEAFSEGAFKRNSILTRYLEFEHFEKAMEFKTKLDQVFEAGEDAEYQPSSTAHDGEMMVLCELLAHGRIKLVPKLPHNDFTIGAPWPRLSPWGFGHEGILAGKVLERDSYLWDVAYTATPSYIAGIPTLDRIIATSIPKLPRGDDERNPRFPFWVDINGDLIPELWHRITQAVIQAAAVRSATTIAEMIRLFRGFLFEFEIEMIVEWGVAADIMAWHDLDEQAIAQAKKKWSHRMFTDEVLRLKSRVGVVAKEWWWAFHGDLERLKDVMVVSEKRRAALLAESDAQAQAVSLAVGSGAAVDDSVDPGGRLVQA